jgi:lysozyme
MIDEAVQVAAALARRFEGCYLRPYLCPAGVPTIGYGATYYEDGVRVTIADLPITCERAESLLFWMVRTRYLPAVVSLCPHLDSPERLAAIVDFAFNLGTGALKVSTLRRKVNAEQWTAACFELLRWDRVGGRVLPGLTKRRKVEAVLFSE